jgi:hypothetical protein
MSEQTYILIFKPLASDVPEILIIRKLLKFALRSCQLKCIDHRIQSGGDAGVDGRLVPNAEVR